MSLKLMWEIRAFCTVVDKGSFIHAARQLGCSPSAMTRAVQHLEEEIGAELILRAQKQLTLTPAGDCYHLFAQRLLATQSEALDQLAELGAAPQGWVRISAPEILALGFLPKTVARFSSLYPEVMVDIRFSDKSLDPVEDQLDFSIRGAFPQSSELIGYRLWDYRRHLYAAPAYLARMGGATPLEPEQLEAHDLVVHTAPRILRDWYFVSPARTLRYTARPRHRFSSGIATLQAALEGAGIARLAGWLAEPEVAAGRLVRVCPAYRLASSKWQDPSMHAVSASPRLSKGARLFLDAVREDAQAIAGLYEAARGQHEAG